MDLRLAEQHMKRRLARQFFFAVNREIAWFLKSNAMNSTPASYSVSGDSVTLNTWKSKTPVTWDWMTSSVEFATDFAYSKISKDSQPAAKPKTSNPFTCRLCSERIPIGVGTPAQMEICYSCGTEKRDRRTRQNDPSGASERSYHGGRFSGAEW